MEFDNDRDRFIYGFDAGIIIDGVVHELDGKYVLIDDEGKGFDKEEEGNLGEVQLCKAKVEEVFARHAKGSTTRT